MIGPRICLRAFDKVPNADNTKVVYVWSAFPGNAFWRGHVFPSYLGNINAHLGRECQWKPRPPLSEVANQFSMGSARVLRSTASGAYDRRVLLYTKKCPELFRQKSCCDHATNPFLNSTPLLPRGKREDASEFVSNGGHAETMRRCVWRCLQCSGFCLRLRHSLQRTNNTLNSLFENYNALKMNSST